MRLKLLAGVFMVALAAPVMGEPLPALMVPHAAQPPRMDATPDDPAWQRAAEIPALTPSIVLGEPAAMPLPTRVLALWDQDFLYVRFVCEDKDVYTPFQERDAPHFQGDVAEIFLDPVGDGRHYFEIQLSPRGGIFDQYLTLTAEPRSDQYGKLIPEVTERDFWSNPGWNCAGLRTVTKVLQRDGHDTSWIAEFALPAAALLKRLGKKQFEPQTLRANFLRYDWQPRPGMKDRELVALNWSTVVRGCPHISPARMGFVKLEQGQN